MRKPRLLPKSAMLPLLLALTGCGSLSKPPSAPYTPPQIPPLPAEIVQEKQEPSLTQRLEKLFRNSRRGRPRHRQAQRLH